MHGLIYRELEKYAEARMGPGGWNRLLAATQLEGRTYTMFQAYGDEDAVRLVEGAARATGVETSAILEDFGRFIVPDLIRFYGVLIRPEWKTFEVLEHTELVIHTVVRRTGGSPPRLVLKRRDESTVEIEYASPRRMCGLAVGIVQGLAAKFGEAVIVAQPKCLLLGDPACLIAVTRA